MEKTLIINRNFNNDKFQKIFTSQFNKQLIGVEKRAMISTRKCLQVLDKINELNLKQKANFNLYDLFSKPNIFVTTLIASGKFTDDEIDAIKNQKTFVYWDGSEVEFDYNKEYDYFTIREKNPLKLEKRWVNEINNPNNDDLYLTFFQFFNGDRLPYIVLNSTSVYFLSYFSYKISLNADNGEIRFDHIDKIDYIDNIEIKFKLPKQLF